MAYEKQTWNTGDVITEEKLNHMEDGIASVGGALIVNENFDETAGTQTLDKTWKEIKEAFNSGKTVLILSGVVEGSSSVLSVKKLTTMPPEGSEEPPTIEYEVGNLETLYRASEENGYPSYGGRM